MVKDPPGSVGNTGSIPGSERAPAEGNGNPFQYSYLENPIDRGAWKTGRLHGLTRVGHDLTTKWASLNSSVGKESTCNAGDPSSISGSGRSPG